MPDKPECTCPNCADILTRDDVVQSHEKLLTDFFADVNAMRLTVQEAMIVSASIAAWMADNIYANSVQGEEDTPEAQDAFVQSYVGMVEEMLEQRIGIDPDEDDDEQTRVVQVGKDSVYVEAMNRLTDPTAAEQPGNASEPVYIETFGGDPSTRH